MAGLDARPSGAASAAFLRLRELGRLLQLVSRGRAFALALLWAGLIWVVSSRPALPLGGAGLLGGTLANFLHAPEFGLLALWLALAAPRRAGWPCLAPRTVAAILLGIGAWAALDEIHQSFTPHRDPSVFDVLTDLVGAIATLGCIAALGGPRACAREFARRLAYGLLACALAASIATYASRAWPDSPWL